MRRMTSLLAGMAGAAALASSLAQAQTSSNDVVVMRRTIAAPVKQSVAEWTPGDWMNVGTHSSCGPNEQTRVVTCRSNGGKGAPVDAAECKDTKPVTTQQAPDTSGCLYKWDPGLYEPASACSPSIAKTRTLTCRWHRYDGVVTASDESLCTEAKPPVTETVRDDTDCRGTWSTTWVEGTCSSYSRTDSSTSTCRQDGNAVDAYNCHLGATPSPTREVACDNPLKDPDFEGANGTNWYYTGSEAAGYGSSGAVSTEFAHGGAKSAKLPMTRSGDMIVLAPVGLVAGQRYTFSYWIGSTASVCVKYAADLSANTHGVAYAVGTRATLCGTGAQAWRQYSQTFVAQGTSATALRIVVAKTSTSGAVYIDDVNVVKN